MVANIGIQQIQHKTSLITSIKEADIPTISRNNNMEGGKGACKSNNITATPMRMTVSPNKKQQREHEQDVIRRALPLRAQW
jgi:hypothetical protein